MWQETYDEIQFVLLYVDKLEIFGQTVAWMDGLHPDRRVKNTNDSISINLLLLTVYKPSRFLWMRVVSQIF